MVGAANNSPALSSKDQYPYFTRIKVTTDYLSAYLAFSFKLMGWTNLCAIYANDVWETGYYNGFITGTNRYGLNVLNDENLREVPYDLTYDRIPDY